MKTLKETVIPVYRAEANFDKASDEAYRMAVSEFGIYEDGHSSVIDEWDRSSCSIEMEFAGYRRSGSMAGNSHVYTFRAWAELEEEETDD